MMAGQMRYPSKSKAARAIPEGGHTADVLSFKKASFSPSLPAMK